MPKIVDHDRYRKELLQGCLALFAERGYGSITMRQIAQGLGVSTGTLYHYFPSKEGLFMQLVQELCEQDISNFLAQAPQDGSVEERLEAVVDFMLQNVQHHHQQLLLWVDFFQQSSQAGDAEAQFLRQVWDRTRDALAAYLQGTDLATVEFILVFLDGLILQFIYSRSFRDLAWFEQQCQLMIQMVIRHE